MSALDDGGLGGRSVTDPVTLTRMRRDLFVDGGFKLPLQEAERAAGLTEADIWKFTEALSA